MLIACLQLNPIVGDVTGNVEKALAAIQTVKDEADVIVLSELFTLGYPPRDLLLWSDIIEENLAGKQRLVNATNSFRGALIFGYAEKNTTDGGKPLFNGVCTAQGGKELQCRFKTLLPTYDVFSERRYFEPGKTEDIKPVLIDVNGSKFPVGVIICEEAWNDAEYWKTHEYPIDPVEIMVNRGAKHIISINASPYRYHYATDKSVSYTRMMMVRKHCIDHLVGFTYVNQVGANDDIIFDGNSFSMEYGGEIIAHAHHCAEDVIMVNLDELKHRALKESIFTRPLEEDILRVLIMGTRDYFTKQPFLNEAFLGLSGGIDSALVAFLGTQAIGRNRIIALGMPSEFSSKGSITDAEKLANQLGIDYLMAPIIKPHHAYREVFDSVLLQLNQKHGNMVNGRSFDGNTASSGVTDQNLQARVRDTILMTGANKFGGLLLLTGNKSESAVGYYTLYDMCGGLGVIADVYKTMVYRLSRYINNTAREEIIPWNSINKKPSAELAADQVDQDTLPPYEWLDPILSRFIEEHQSSRQIISEFATVENEARYAHETAEAFGKPRNLIKNIEWVCRAVIQQQWKRDQSARGLKVTGRHFKFGWEVPIVHRSKL